MHQGAVHLFVQFAVACHDTGDGISKVGRLDSPLSRTSAGCTNEPCASRATTTFWQLVPRSPTTLVSKPMLSLEEACLHWK